MAADNLETDKEEDDMDNTNNTNPTRAKIATELKQLAEVRTQVSSRMHYDTIEGLILASGLPYQLVREGCNDLGEIVHGWRYRWTSKWTSGAALYIQETEAGRQVQTPRQALDLLQRVLED